MTKEQIELENELRGHLRAALELANKVGTQRAAGQDFGETAIEDASGVFGLVARSLEILEDDLDHFYDTNEWRTLATREVELFEEETLAWSQE